MKSPLAVALLLPALLLLAGCVPAMPTPTPTTSGGPASSPPTASATPTAETTAPAEPVTAAVVVVTASTLSVFGTDGSTLVSADYEEDAAGVAAELAEFLGAPTTVSTTAEETGSCPTRTLYDFGGLVLGTPQGLGSPAAIGAPGTYDVVVTTAAVGGIPVETVGGQRVGATRAAFVSAIGDEAELEFGGSGSDLGFDIVNPAADLYDQIGTYAAFDGGVLTTLISPAVVRFVGDCG